MKRYGLKRIDINMVESNYGKLVENTHFNAKNETMDDENLKEITLNETGMLMALGTEGLHFLSSVLRSKLDGYELSEEQIWEIYCECDGFGKLSSEDLLNINGGWDWSHVRDSSSEALKNAELKAKSFLIDMYNLK